MECHKPLAIVGTPGENIDSLLAEISGAAPAAVAVEAATAAAVVQSTEAAEKSSTGRVPVSPLAKKMAKGFFVFT